MEKGGIEETGILCDDLMLHGASHLSSSCLSVLVVCADSFSEITTRTVWPHRGKSSAELSLPDPPSFFNAEFSVSFELSSRQERQKFIGPGETISVCMHNGRPPHDAKDELLHR